MMKDVEIKITKYTDVSFLRLANSFCSGKDSKMSLARAYRLGHSPIRTQKFRIEVHNLYLMTASQLVRSHVGLQFYQGTQRTDKGARDFRDVCKRIAGDMIDAFRSDNPMMLAEITDRILSLPDEFGRYSKVSLMGDFNAESFLNMCHKRLCFKASAETKWLWEKIVEKMKDVDPDLAKHCVPQCVFRGSICPEVPCCGFIERPEGKNALMAYKTLFSVHA